MGAPGGFRVRRDPAFDLGDAPRQRRLLLLELKLRRLEQVGDPAERAVQPAPGTDGDQCLVAAGVFDDVQQKGEIVVERPYQHLIADVRPLQGKRVEQPVHVGDDEDRGPGVPRAPDVVARVDAIGRSRVGALEGAAERRGNDAADFVWLEGERQFARDFVSEALARQGAAVLRRRDQRRRALRSQQLERPRLDHEHLVQVRRRRVRRGKPVRWNAHPERETQSRLLRVGDHGRPLGVADDGLAQITNAVFLQDVGDVVDLVRGLGINGVAGPVEAEIGVHHDHEPATLHYELIDCIK